MQTIPLLQCSRPSSSRNEPTSGEAVPAAPRTPTNPTPPKPIQEGPLSNPIPSPSYVMARPAQSARAHTDERLHLSEQVRPSTTKKGEHVGKKTPQNAPSSSVIHEGIVVGSLAAMHPRWIAGCRVWNLPLWILSLAKKKKKGPVRPVSPRSRQVPWAGLGSRGAEREWRRPGILRQS